MSRGPGREGMLLVDKPVGPTSHDVVAGVRRALGMRRVGHTGTLDPFASGLLLLLLGSATRLSGLLDGFEKEYVAVARLGIRTETDDPEGDPVAESEGWRTLDRATVEAALDAFRGESDQVPPAYSARKVAGRPAHRRVRAGETVVLPPSRITVHEIALESLDLPEVRFRVRCSTGTYVRALARDLGERLGVGGHLTALRRTRIGPFTVEEAVAPEAVATLEPGGRGWRTPLETVGHLPVVALSPGESARIERGQPIDLPPELADTTHDLALAFEDRLVAIAVASEGRIRPRKVFPR